MLWFFGPETCGILAPRPGIEHSPSALQGNVLTTGLPGKSLLIDDIEFSFFNIMAQPLFPWTK